MRSATASAQYSYDADPALSGPPAGRADDWEGNGRKATRDLPEHTSLLTPSSALAFHSATSANSPAVLADLGTVPSTNNSVTSDVSSTRCSISASSADCHRRGDHNREAASVADATTTKSYSQGLTGALAEYRIQAGTSGTTSTSAPLPVRRASARASAPGRASAWMVTPEPAAAISPTTSTWSGYSPSAEPRATPTG